MENKLPANGDAVTWFQGPETLLKIRTYQNNEW